MKEIIKIKGSCKQCYFGKYEHGMGLACWHPYWNTLGIDHAYDNLEVTSTSEIPKECPLRKESLTIEYVLEE